MDAGWTSCKIPKKKHTRSSTSAARRQTARRTACCGLNTVRDRRRQPTSSTSRTTAAIASTGTESSIPGGWPFLSAHFTLAAAPSLSLRSLQGQGGDFDFGCILNRTEIKIPALSQKTRQGRAPSRANEERLGQPAIGTIGGIV